MKTSIIILISFFFLQQNAYSQDKDNSKLIEKTANGICSCVNSYTKGMDEDVKQLLVKTFEYQMADDKEGYMEYAKTISEDLEGRMKSQMAILKENEASYSQCKSKNNKALELLTSDNEDLEKEVQTKIVEVLEKDKNCSFAAALSKVAVKK